MKLSDKIKQNLTAAYITGCTALSAGVTAHAEGELDGVTTSVTNSIQDIVNVITPIAWALVVLVLIIMGCILIWGGDKAKAVIKAHITAVVIGCVLIAGAATLADWLVGSLTSNFGTGA